MKILHIIKYTSKNYGGMPYALQNIVKLEREQLNFSSSVLTIADQQPNLELEGVVEELVYFKSFGVLNGYREARNWLRNNGGQYDLIQFHGVWNRFILDLLSVAAAEDFNFTLWPHCSLDIHDLQKKKVLKKIIGAFFLKQKFKKCTRFVLTSDKEVQNSTFYAPSFNHYILPLPIPQLNSVLDFKDLGIADGKFNFIFLSRFDPKKGLVELIDAFKELFERHDNIRLILAGSDSSAFSKLVLEKVDNELPQDKVLVPGFLNDADKLAALKQSHCFLLPSKYENFGISIIESLQTGLPALITKEVYIYEDLDKFDAVWLCEPNALSIKETCELILTNQDAIGEKRKKAELAAKQYSPEVLAESYRKFYSTVA